MDPKNIAAFVVSTGVKSNLVEIPRKYIIKECVLCRRSKPMYVDRYGLCYGCYQIIRILVIRKHGKFARIWVAAAIDEYHAPVKCKFCGGLIYPDQSKGEYHINRAKRPICPKCEPIYKAAYRDAVQYKRLSRRKAANG